MRLVGLMLLVPAFAAADGVPTPAPPPKTLAAAAARCAKNDAKACVKAGELYTTAYYSRDGGPDTYPDKSRAAYHKACELDDLDGCFGVAWWYSEGRDYRTAAAMFEPLCRGHHVASCAMLGMAYERGDGVARDVPRATKLFEQACTEATDQGCLSGCDMLGLQYQYSEPTKALAIYDRACDVGCMNSCDVAARMHRDGQGAAPDPTKSAAEFQRACDKGFPPSCESLSLLVKDPKQAKQLHARACRLSEDQVESCR